MKRLGFIFGILVMAAGAFFVWKVNHPTFDTGPIKTQSAIKDLDELRVWLGGDGVPFLGKGIISNLENLLIEAELIEGNHQAIVATKTRLGEWQLRHGHVKEATTQLSEALQLAEVHQLPESTKSKVRLSLAITHLRGGEIDHCIHHHNPVRCLFPIEKEGAWEDTSGAMNASELLRANLASNPDDTGARWLLNLAQMAAGNYPEGLSEAELIPPSTVASSHEAPVFRDIAGELGIDCFNLAGGVAMDDFDGDGFLDIVTSTWDPNGQTHYFHNNGDGTFDDWSERSGLSGQYGVLNIETADFNNDGRLDLYFLRGAWMGGIHGRQRNSLMRQEADGTFTDVTNESGLGATAHPSLSAGWADYDLDGDLDLYVGNDNSLDELFRNNGDETFTNVAGELGIANRSVPRGVAWGDYDNDGDPDLFVSNFEKRNAFYRNDGGESFVEIGESLGLNIGEFNGDSFASWFWDYDNDGWLDLFVASFAQTGIDQVAADYIGLPAEGERLRLFRNTGGDFIDVTKETGLYQINKPMGANFGDIDNDGFLDIYLGNGEPAMETLFPNRMYRNLDGNNFADVTTASKTGHLQKGHGIAFGDLDNDGDQDIYAQLGGAFPDDKFHNALFENPGSDHHWLTIQLEGSPSNRSALGARIRLILEMETGEKRELHRVVGSGGSFGSSSLQQEIGLGACLKISELRIEWPVSRTTQTLTDVELNQAIRVLEGDSTFTKVTSRKIELGKPK